jgi:hypothetical protein
MTLTALDALDTDLLDALAAVERARRRLEQARSAGGSTVRGSTAGVPALAAASDPNRAQRPDECVIRGVRYRLVPNAHEVIEAALARKTAARG